MTSLREIDADLPNGFHDAHLETVTVCFALNRAELDLQLSVGDPDAATAQEREGYKKAKLILNDLVYFVIDPPYLNHEYPRASAALRIDGGEATDDPASTTPKPRCALPPDAFAYWFFITPWNSFIHVAARGATLQWM